jgi:hypothetical protein
MSEGSAHETEKIARQATWIKPNRKWRNAFSQPTVFESLQMAVVSAQQIKLLQFSKPFSEDCYGLQP